MAKPRKEPKIIIKINILTLWKIYKWVRKKLRLPTVKVDDKISSITAGEQKL